MRHVLHIITKKNDSLARTVIEQQASTADQKVQSVDLTAPDADYDKLVREIFEADSIAVW
ncbi:MAG: hypothetical protein JWO95_159 [Verrucomicrobiales bacterium]|nr:hypothetical protein [Verrucomicrobiales bacterium]